MTIIPRAFAATALLLAVPAWSANPTGTEQDLTTKQVLARTPEPSKGLEDQVQMLTRTVQELQTEIDRLRAEKANRADLDHDPNDHPLWP
jgi:hypothetical protein